MQHHGPKGKAGQASTMHMRLLLVLQKPDSGWHDAEQDTALPNDSGPHCWTPVHGPFGPIQKGGNTGSKLRLQLPVLQPQVEDVRGLDQDAGAVPVQDKMEDMWLLCDSSDTKV